jgi:HK97 family phage major capsid protein
MTLNAMKEKLVDLQSKATALNALAANENRDLTTTEKSEFNAVMNEFEGMHLEVVETEKRAAFLASSKEYMSGMSQPGKKGETQRAEIKGIDMMTFFRKVRNFKFPNEYRDMSMGDPTAGGYLIPELFMPGMKMIAAEPGIIRPRASVIPAGSPPDAKINIPVLNQGTNGEFGGVSVSWIAEAGTKAETTAVIAEMELEPKEVAASMVVTDKLLRNAPEVSGIFEGLLRGALTRAEEVAFISGTGVGTPMGIISAACTITATRTSASSISFTDVSGMMGKLLATSWGNAVWIANVSTLPKLLALADAVGNSIFIQGDVTKAIPSTLYGMPVIFTGLNSTLGTKGDLMLVDCAYYLIKDGAGPFVAASPHVHWTTNKTVIKIFSNVDGDSWVSAPLTLADGTTKVSPFVVLT